MNALEVLKIFQTRQVLMENSHFVYTSWKHGSHYLNKDRIYSHVTDISRLCFSIAERFAGDEIQVVVGPALGGIVLSQWTAFHLSTLTNREVLGIFAEKDGGDFVFNRGYGELVRGKVVLVVEDILTTGDSAKKVIRLVRASDGSVAGLGALCNRGNVIEGDLLNVLRLETLLDVNLDVWDEVDCPLCKSGIPINTKVGKGREFLKRKQSQPTG